MIANVADVRMLMALRPLSWMEILESEFKIKIVRDEHLVSLKYDQIESPMHLPIVQQCRGMVVDVLSRKILAHPYDKFWNFGESHAASIDWSTARVQEKLDGSLMILYFDPRSSIWRVASSGHPTAGGSFGRGHESGTFRDAFGRLWYDNQARFPSYEARDVAFFFELCDQPNRVVVQHDRPRLVLHGARSMTTARELARGTLALAASALNVELVREFPITSAAEALEAAAALNPVKQEGFVVVDAAFNRVKIKSPRYVVLHHMKGDATPRRAIELWRSGETSELLAHFPEMTDVIQPVQDELERIAAAAVTDFAENVPRASRKAFAVAIKDKPWAPVLFKMIDRGGTLDVAKDIMRRMHLAALERMVLP